MNETKIRKSFLTPEDRSGLAKRFIELGKDPAITEEVVLLLVSDLEEDRIFLGEAIIAVRQNLVVKQVAAVDAKRNRIYRSLLRRMDSVVLREKVGASEAFELVNPVFEKVGRFYSLGYVAKSERFAALIKDLSAPVYKAALTLLEVSDILEEFEGVQGEFETVQAQRMDADSDGNAPTLSEANARIDPTLQVFAANIAYYAKKKPEIYRSIYEKTDKVIAEIMSKARARKTRSFLASYTQDEEDNSDSLDQMPDLQMAEN